MVATILAAHVALIYGLLQVREVRDAAREVAPMFVDLIAPPANYGFQPMGYGGLYGNQAMGQPGSLGGNLGTGFGVGVPSSTSGTFYSGARSQPDRSSRSR